MYYACKYTGGATYTQETAYTYHDEIFTYNPALDTWNITGHPGQQDCSARQYVD